MKSYWVPGLLTNDPEPPSQARFDPAREFPGLNKPAGGFWTSLWREDWGPEWGLWWAYHYEPTNELVVYLPVWEVDLEGLRVKAAGLERPRFGAYEEEGWDALLVDPVGLEHQAPPEAHRWWAGWDVRTVWLPRWPGERRLRYLGTLQEVVPRETTEAYLREVRRVVEELE